MATLQDYGISKVVDLSPQEATIKITEHHSRAGGRRHSVSCWARFLRRPPWDDPPLAS